MNMLMESFFKTYGIIILLLVVFAAFMVYYYLKNSSFKKQEDQFQKALKIGDKVKTYSGFYGTIAKITETTDGTVISLKLSENATIDVDIRALMGIDTKTEVESTVADKIAEIREKETQQKEEAKKVDQTTDAKQTKNVKEAPKEEIEKSQKPEQKIVEPKVKKTAEKQVKDKSADKTNKKNK